jgi:hypothetical protein
MSNITKLNEVKSNPKRDEVLNILEAVVNHVKEAQTVGDMTMLIKIDGEYIRFSSSIEDIMSVVAQYELAKFDALRRMTQ